MSSANTFQCSADHRSRTACQGEGFFREHEGKRYCVLHCPCDDKGESFLGAVKRKISAHDWNFHGVWFSEAIDLFREQEATGMVDFSNAKFRGYVDFSKCRILADSSILFIATEFHDRAMFVDTRFGNEVSFNYVEFADGANFEDARFEGHAGFYETRGKGELYFVRATLESGLTVRSPQFAGEICFRHASLSGPIEVSGTDRSTLLAQRLDLWGAIIATPESVTFKECRLRSDWFRLVDPSRFRFLDVRWDIAPARMLVKDSWYRELGEPGHEALSAVHRALAANAEEHLRFDEASRFRYAAFDSMRLRLFHGWAIWDVRWWYWALSGYGERAGRALSILLGIWVVFAGLYMLPGVGFERWEVKAANEKEAISAQPDVHGAPLGFTSALIHSLEVMSFQKPSPNPASPPAHALVALEGILGPLQAALFALAIRRKVSH
ncbi:pentapeptide repeat-containing protein [Paraburkholderia pallida]|uniref:Pentapeptide repeat-containing protein n=1 Tax=Paraburkholderia pallida TaxID=2547399 RepID=A0A4P7CYY6_9BURK|nr:pentapeptide repeat-containing protein [Paraburkholderia pallida]QBR01516.1 hypothetical protein E1956_30505 [Paraburkholderia pallida]